MWLIHNTHIHKLGPDFILVESLELSSSLLSATGESTFGVGVSFSKMMALAILLNNSHLVGSS
jgi:hypothetical protein